MTYLINKKMYSVNTYDGEALMQSLVNTYEDYILTSSRETLKKKDDDAAQERVIRKGSSLFKTEDFVRKAGYDNYDHTRVKVIESPTEPRFTEIGSVII